MRIYVISDLHLEHNPWWTFPEVVPAFDVAVIAGDVDGSVTSSLRALEQVSLLAEKPVIFVPGNHEFHSSVLQDNLQRGFDHAVNRSNVHLLQRRSVVLGEVRFVGATLWTDFDLFGTKQISMLVAEQCNDDHRSIYYRDTDDHLAGFTPKDARQEHLADRQFIEETLSDPHDGPTIVVTHHLPSPESIPERFRDDTLSPTYASDLSGLILKYQPSLWIHGHTHTPCDYTIGSTRVICNPKGFGPHPKTGDYDGAKPADTLVVEVGS